MNPLYLLLIFLCLSQVRVFSAEQKQNLDNLIYKSDLVFEGDVVRIAHNVLGTETVEDYDLLYVQPRRVFKKGCCGVKADSLVAIVARARITKGIHALDTGGPWGTRIQFPSEMSSKGELKYADLPATGLFFLKIINTRSDDIYAGSAIWAKSGVKDSNFLGRCDQVRELAKHIDKEDSGLCQSVLWIIAIAGAGSICFFLWRRGNQKLINP